MNWQDFKQSARDNYWIIAALIFFICWKFFLVGVLWHDRAIPPEPDDAFNYIAHIASVTNCNWFEFCDYNQISLTNSSGFVYLTYRLFFGTLAKLIGITPEAIYHLSFYIGTFLLALVLYPFIRIFATDRKQAAWFIFFLSFYHGLGETHGFYWVVPSFFLVLLFLAVSSYILQSQLRLTVWFFLLVLLYSFSHPLNVYLAFVWPLYLLFLAFLGREKEKSVWMRSGFAFFLVLFFAFLVSYSLSRTQPVNEPYAYSPLEITSQSPEKNSPLLPSETKVTETLPFLSHLGISLHEKVYWLDRAYFRWLMPHWLFLFPLLGCFFVLIYYHQFRVLSFYLSALVFFLVATFLHPFGYRSGILLWLSTYVLWAAGSWYFIQFIQDTFRGAAKNVITMLVAILLVLFFCLHLLFGFLYNENLNVRRNYSVPPELKMYLLERIHQDDAVSLPPELITTELASLPALRGRLVYPEQAPQYLVLTDQAKIKKPAHSQAYQLSYWIIEKVGSTPKENTPNALPPDVPQGYRLEAQFGSFLVYQKVP